MSVTADVEFQSGMHTYFLEMNSPCRGTYFFLEMSTSSSNMKKQQDCVPDHFLLTLLTNIEK